MDFKEFLDSLNNTFAITHPTDPDQPGIQDVANKLDNDLAITHPTQVLTPTPVDTADNAFLDKLMGGNKEVIPLQDKSPALPSFVPPTVPAAQSPDTISPPAAAQKPMRSVSSVSVPSTATNEPSADNDVSNFIAKKYGYGPGLDQKALIAAQTAANQGRLFANIGDAVSSIAKGISHSNQPTDHNFYSNLSQEAAAPVQDILQRRQAAVQDQNFATQQEDLDPSSVKATIMRKQLAPLAREVGLNPTDLAGLGVSDLKTFATGPLEFAAKLQQQKQIAADNRDMRKLLYQNQLGEKEEKRESEALRQLQTNKLYEQVQDHSKNADNIQDLIRSATSNPQAANALPTEMGLFLSKGQRLHTSTIDSMKGGSQALGSRLQQWMQTSKAGTITPENANSMLQLVQQEAGGAEKVKSQLEKEAADNYKRIYGKTPRWFSPQSSQSRSMSSAKITITNGKETFQIDPSDLADAQKDGFRQVQ